MKSAIQLFGIIPTKIVSQKVLVQTMPFGLAAVIDKQTWLDQDKNFTLVLSQS